MSRNGWRPEDSPEFQDMQHLNEAPGWWIWLLRVLVWAAITVIFIWVGATVCFLFLGISIPTFAWLLPLGLVGAIAGLVRIIVSLGRKRQSNEKTQKPETKP